MNRKRNGAGAWALLPVKRPAGAKSRLATVLPQAERQALQRAMLCDVLKGLAAASRLEGIAVISADRETGEVARRCGAIHIPELPECENVNLAVDLGVRKLQEAGARIVAIIPADLPLLDGAELDLAIERVEAENRLVVVPDRHELGTNALIFPAAVPPSFEFGPGSYQRHLSRPGDPAPVAMALRSMELDIDTPVDIARFVETDVASAAAPRTHGVLTLALARREKLVCEDV